MTDRELWAENAARSGSRPDDDEPDAIPTRRGVLRAVGVAMTAALGAGCLSNPWRPGRTESRSGDGTESTTVEDDANGGGSDDTDPDGEGTTDGEVKTDADDRTFDADRPTEPTTDDDATTTATTPPEEMDPDQIVEVAPDGFLYAPETFEIAVGDTVHWEWKDGGHNVRVKEKPDGSDFEGTPGSDSDTYGEGYLYAHTYSVAGD
jgi:plastocyanin